MSNRSPCKVCARVDDFARIELDTLMGDPSAWPATVWGNFNPPKGALPASYRRFGAVEMGLAWLREKGHEDLGPGDVRKHYQYDVPKVAASPDDLVATGLIARGNVASGVDTINPLKYIEYYNTGIEVGIEGLKLIRERIETLKAAGQDVPMALVKMAVEAGRSLALSQAQIRARGQNFGDEGDPDDGFRAGSAPEPSPRMGHHRARVIDGETVVVRDVGPQDRAAYNERARQEAGVELPER